MLPPELWIVEYGLRIVWASSRPVRPGPAPKVGALVPRLGEGEERRVDQPADGHVRELVQEVVERHPWKKNVHDI